ncbi:hypothetical protein T439DRAFT_181968 [Meredithblackwellia eburnea MCA 4105]
MGLWTRIVLHSVGFPWCWSPRPTPQALAQSFILRQPPESLDGHVLQPSSLRGVDHHLLLLNCPSGTHQSLSEPTRPARAKRNSNDHVSSVQCRTPRTHTIFRPSSSSSNHAS